jgi:protein involved in polysaccharide export with SLBB domain
MGFFRAVTAFSLLLPICAGCSPFRNRIPSECVSPKLLDRPRDSQNSINFLCLRQDPAPVYILGPRDILGIYIEGIVQEEGNLPPVMQRMANVHLPPAIGRAVPVREDGTISLPFVPPIVAAGRSVTDLETVIHRAYTEEHQILARNHDQVIVTIMQPRTYNVLVIREDAGTTGGPGTAGMTPGGMGPGGTTWGSNKRGMTYSLDLPAQENDVLHALSASGGLPGLDAKNEITILRGRFVDAVTRDNIVKQLTDLSAINGDPLSGGRNIVRIPLRYGPDDPAPRLQQSDIILGNGDIILIESRQAEIFYTGGVLGGGQHPIPRDYDLDILGAIAIASSASGGIAASPGARGGSFGTSIGGGNGLLPPTRIVVVRMIDGKQVPISVDMKKALVDPNSRILIQPNDIVILEYTEFEMAINTILGMIQFNYLFNNNR